MKRILFLLMTFGSVCAMETNNDQKPTTYPTQKIVEIVHDVAQRKYGACNPDNITVRLRHKYCFYLNDNPTDKGLILQCKNKIPIKMHLPTGTLEFAEINGYTHGANGLFLQDILKVMRCTEVYCEPEDQATEYFRVLQVEDIQLPPANFKTPSKR